MSSASDRVRAEARLGAAIDVGSNSVHLLVGAIGTEGVIPLLDVSELLGLGDALDRTGHLAPDARERLLETLLRFVAAARDLDATELTLLGTEPMRRTADRTAIEQQILRATGLALHVLRHEDEALLTLLGVTMGAPLGGSLLVVDIGGGSSEYVLAAPDGPPIAGGIAIGSARLSASLVAHDPPTRDEVATLRAEAARLVATTPAGTPADGVMVGGTATNLVKLVAGGVLGDRLAATELPALWALLESITAAEISSRYLVNPRRAGMLAAGAAIVEAFMLHNGLASVSVSRASLREGAIIARHRGGPAWLGQLPRIVAGGEAVATGS